MNRIAWTSIVAVLTAGVALGQDAAPVAAFGGEPQGLVVHEWGVWVRTCTDHGTRWGSPEEMIRQLPPFVRVVKSESPPDRQHHGWDKPVIHLYGADGLAVNLKVGTPQGHPTAYFPAASLSVKKISVTDAGIQSVYTLTGCLGIDWSGTLASRPQGELPKVEAGHWWERARQVPSAYFRNKDSEERFLFYEATAFQEPVVVGDVTAEALTLILSPPVRNPFLPETGGVETEPVGPVLVIINDGAQRWIQRIETISAQRPVVLKRSDVLRISATEQEILAAAESQWRSYGLTRDEAAAIVAVWKPDLLGTPGFLVISRMPPPLYEKMFPLTVTPKPKELVRAGVVFDTLPGRMERLRWLPSLREVFEAWGRDLAREDALVVQHSAETRLARVGDLARPVLEDLAQRGSDVQRDQAAKLLALLTPEKVDGPLIPEPQPDHWFRSRAQDEAGQKEWDGQLPALTAFDFPDSVAIAKALATRKGPLRLPNLKKISPKTLTALIQKEDVEIPLIETLELIQEPDGSVTEDFVLPEDFQKRHQQQRQ